MKPTLLKVSSGPAQSFSVRRDNIPHFNNQWHYHDEVELIHFKSGEGTQFIGDHIKHFRSGDMVLVGKQLPHYWRFDDSYFQDDSKKTVDVRVAHFCEDFWGANFLQLHENRGIKSVLENARRGIEITGNAKQTIAGLLEKMLVAQGSERIILLMEALIIITSNNNPVLLSSYDFTKPAYDSCNDRINAVYNYSIANFKNNIQLDEIASVANISPTSFCRYFKSRTRKTYFQFLLELKVEHACKLLLDNQSLIKQVCYESGFNNFASFHKYFKIITGKSPQQYQREFA